MPSRPLRRRTDDAFQRWLERSIREPVFIDRSDGEKAAEKWLIEERAKTEKWNRWVSKWAFTCKVGIPIAAAAFLLGVGVGTIVVR